MADELHKLRKGLIDGSNKPLLAGLLDDLFEEKILNYAEVENIDEGYRLCSDKMRALVDTVRKKGDRSSEILILKVSARDVMLSEKLGIPANLPLSIQEHNVSISRQPEIYGITLCSEKDFKRITSGEHEIYSIRKREERTRLALIICNEIFADPNFIQRKGAECDVLGMKELLTGLGYKVQVKKDLTVQEMQGTMKTFSHEKDHTTSDSTFLVFMSHGLRDRICGTNTQFITNEQNNVLHVDEIFNTFNNVNCPALENKPKIIIIQACRGDENSRVMVSDSPCALPSPDQEVLEDDGMRIVQRERDFACFFATTPDTVSWRSPKTGSLFIQRLIQHMKADAHRYSIEEIFRNVQLSFENGIQMPTRERITLVKKFYLFPGH